MLSRLRTNKLNIFSARSIWTVFFAISVMVGASPCFAGKATIAVASNFTHTAKSLQTEFESTHPHTLTLIFGATGKLFAQITHGAPYDVFLAADEKTPALLINQNLADKMAIKPFTYALGRIALWAPHANKPVTEKAILTAGEHTKLAIANPKLAPYGQASIEILNALSLTEKNQQGLIIGENIAQTFQFVASGNVEFGFVAYSQLLHQKTPKHEFWLVPKENHAPIKQNAALLNSGKANNAAISFLTFLSGEKAKQIIRSQGYWVD